MHTYLYIEGPVRRGRTATSPCPRAPCSRRASRRLYIYVYLSLSLYIYIYIVYKYIYIYVYMCIYINIYM